MGARKLSLGPQELKLLLTLESRGIVVFDFRTVKKVLETSDASAKNVLLRLKRKGRVQDIKRGHYLLVPAKAGYEGSWSETPYAILPHLLEEYYVAFWTALNHWGFTEQVPRTVFVVTPRRKRAFRYGPTKFEFVTLKRSRFFGFVEEKLPEGSFRISDKEKTILDCAAFPAYCGGIEEVAKALWISRKEIEVPKLRSYALRYDSNVAIRRIGFILEHLGLKKSASAFVRSMKFKGLMKLDPWGPSKAHSYSKKYGLIINMPESELARWRDF